MDMGGLGVAYLDLSVSKKFGVWLKGNHPTQTIFQYVEQQWIAITVLYVFLLINVIKINKWTFPQIFLGQCVFENCVPEKKSVSENCVPEKKSVSEKCIPEKKFTLKYCTGKEFGSQILLPTKYFNKIT